MKQKPTYLKLKKQVSRIKKENEILKLNTASDIEDHKTGTTQLKNVTKKTEDLLKKLDEIERLANFGTWEFYLVQDTIWWSPQTYRIFERTPQDIELNNDS